jgi:transcriptional regulator with XRE-family HTH domain
MTRTLGVNIRTIRQTRKLSQVALAQQCGIYRSYLSRIETGRANPSLTAIVALANALNVTPVDLLLANPDASVQLETS